MKIRPFTPQKRGYTIFDNSVIDCLMPELSPASWKILSLIIRETRGWQRNTAQITYNVIAEKTGIKHPSTISKALNELETAGIILRPDSKENIALNTDLIIDTSKNEVLPVGTSKNEVKPTSKNEVKPTSKNEVLPCCSSIYIKQSEETNIKQSDDDVSPRLNSLGITTSDINKLLENARLNYGDNWQQQITAWIDYCDHQENIVNPAGLIIVKIKKGEIAPAPAPDDPAAIIDHNPALLEI